MTTTGALGGTWRAEITAAGAIEPWDGSPPLDWAIAADDRWHRPATEPAVRQERQRGTPVVETRVRIPGGDAVQRVWTTADGPGRTLVEVHNDSPLPIAVAFTRPDLLTSRPPTGVPIEGIDLPAASVLVPIGHRTRVVVGLAHDGGGPGALPAGFADADATVRGWRTMAERAGRLVLPDPRLDDLVVAARCDLLLEGWDAPDDDPVGFLLALGEWQRLGELTPAQAAETAADVAAAVATLARADGWDVDAALAAAGRVLHHAGDRRAVGDLVALVTRRPPVALPSPDDPPPTGIRVAPWVERVLAVDGALLPGGLAPSWRGAPVEAYGLPCGVDGRLSFALRWHGEHPAVLWELEGSPTTVTAPVLAPWWSTTAARGEALWRPEAAHPAPGRAAT